MSGGARIDPLSIPQIQSRKSAMNSPEAIETAQRILKEHGFENLIEVGGDKEALILMGEFPLNGETAQAYLKAKGEILKETRIELFAYERVENNRVYVTVV